MLFYIRQRHFRGGIIIKSKSTEPSIVEHRVDKGGCASMIVVGRHQLVARRRAKTGGVVVDVMVMVNILA